MIQRVDQSADPVDAASHQLTRWVIAGWLSGIEGPAQPIWVLQRDISEGGGVTPRLECGARISPITGIQVARECHPLEQGIQGLIGRNYGLGDVHRRTVALMTPKGMHALAIDDFLSLSPVQARAMLSDWLATFVAGGEGPQAAAKHAVASVMEGIDEAAVAQTMATFRDAGSHYGFFDADPAARQVIRAYLQSFCEGSTISGVQNLRAAVQDGPVLLLCNHLAYCDTVLKDMLLAQAGAAELADRLTAVAGPKVYETPFRRMASLAIGTLKTAQSTAIAHSQTSLTPRQVAEIAVGTMRTAHSLMRDGYLIVLYGEGSRSRNQRLGPFIKAIRKYAKMDGVQLVPLALSGTAEVMPVGQLLMHPGQVHLEIGSPISTAEHGAAAAVEQCWHTIAELLPSRHQPSSGTAVWR